jgi:sugar phosphate permease
LASAVLGSTPYLSELLIGNAAFAFLERGVSWRWAFAGPGALVFVAGIMLYLCLREPPVGRFITKSKASARLPLAWDPNP